MLGAGLDLIDVCRGIVSGRSETNFTSQNLRKVDTGPDHPS